MASAAYEGNFKVWLLPTEPADWNDEDSPTVTQAAIEAGTRMLRLISDGGVSYQFTTNTASQARMDDGKVGHNIGTREITGLEMIFERDFPVADDAMWNYFQYGDKRWMVISPNGDLDDIADGEILHVFEVETGEKQLVSPGRDTIQNFSVSLAVQDWNLDVEYEETA